MHGIKRARLCVGADKSHFCSTETRYANKASDKCGGLTPADRQMFLSNPFQLFDNLRSHSARVLLSRAGLTAEGLLLIDWLRAVFSRMAQCPWGNFADARSQRVVATTWSASDDARGACCFWLRWRQLGGIICSSWCGAVCALDVKFDDC